MDIIGANFGFEPPGMGNNSVGKLSSVGVVPTSENSSSSADFSAALAAAGTDITQSLQKAEAVSIAGIKGEASAYEVASSVMEAEQSLRMAISVRDKIIAAYLEISRMQI